MVTGMECNDADFYIMKYMDDEITEEEAEKLNSHLQGCAHCREAFQIYDSMLMQFSALPEFKAPENFEMEVMAKITMLSEGKYEVILTAKEKVWRNVWGTFTVLFGAGTILVLYREPIMLSLSQNPYIGDHIKQLMPVAQRVTESTEVIRSTMDSTIQWTDTILTNSMGLLFAILAALCAVQFYLLHRRRKPNKADE